MDRLCEVCPIGKNILDVSSRGSKVKKLMQGRVQVSLIVFYPILATNKKEKRNSMRPKGKQHLVNGKVVWVKMKKEVTQKSSESYFICYPCCVLLNGAPEELKGCCLGLAENYGFEIRVPGVSLELVAGSGTH